jgi:hypothetical protein
VGASWGSVCSQRPDIDRQTDRHANFIKREMHFPTPKIKSNLIPQIQLYSKR